MDCRVRCIVYTFSLRTRCGMQTASKRGLEGRDEVSAFSFHTRGSPIVLSSRDLVSATRPATNYKNKTLKRVKHMFLYVLYPNVIYMYVHELGYLQNELLHLQTQ